MIRCAYCAKIAYKTAADAHFNLTELKARGLDVESARVYFCEEGGSWHWGHGPNRRLTPSQRAKRLRKRRQRFLDTGQSQS
jgi:hypothetical protein